MMKTDLNTFYRGIGAQILAVRRDERKITQQMLASKTSLSRTSIANIERGHQRLLLHHFVEIAAALEVQLNRLLPSKKATASAELEMLSHLSPSAVEWVASTLATRKVKKP